MGPWKSVMGAEVEGLRSRPGLSAVVDAMLGGLYGGKGGEEGEEEDGSCVPARAVVPR